MAVSDQQKLDFLLKKIGYTKTKTGSVEGTGAISGTPKQPFAEAIPSPLVVANSSLWNEADSIPATPPGSDTVQVKVYPTTSALRMTADATSSGQRAFIAYSTYNDTSSARLTNWIDTQFGALYLIKVFKGDPNSGGVALSSGATNENWFFDYSAGVLNFNDSNVPSGVTDTNIYIVGYRYIGQTGAPTSGISTFSYLDLTVERNLDVGIQGGISTFRHNVQLLDDDKLQLGSSQDFQIYHESSTHKSIIKETGASGLHFQGSNIVFDNSAGNKRYLNLVDGGAVQLYYNAAPGGASKLETTNTGVSITGNSVVSGNVSAVDGIFSGNVSIAGTLTYEDVTNVDSVGILTARSGIKVLAGGADIVGVVTATGADINGDIDVDGHTELDNVNIVGVTTAAGHILPATDITYDLGASSKQWRNLYADNIISAPGNGFIGPDLTVRNLKATGLSTFRDLDVDGHTNLDNVSVAGVTTFAGIIDGVAGENKIPFLYAGLTNLPNASDYHGMFAHVHSNGKAYYAHDMGSTITVTVGQDNVGGQSTGVFYFNGTEKPANFPLLRNTTYIFDQSHSTNANYGSAGAHPLMFSAGPGGDHNGNGHYMTGVTYKLDGTAVTMMQYTSGFTSATSRTVEWKVPANAPLTLYYWCHHHTGQGNSLSLSDGGWLELANKNKFGVVGAGTETYNIGILTATQLEVNGNADFSGITEVYHLNVLGIGTFTAPVDINSTLDVSGISTFNSNVDINADIDVDGHTELDNVNISGVVTATTFIGDGDFFDIDVDGHTDLDNVTVAGVTTFFEQVTVNAPIDLNSDIDVDGHTNLDNVSVAGVTTFAANTRFNSTLAVHDGTTGSNGQYLKSIGTGVTWASFPTLRTRDTITASAGQQTFHFSYNVGFIDVFVNGIKLTDSEFTATNGTAVVLSVGCFVGDIVELVSYNIVSQAAGGGGGGNLNNIVEDTSPQLGGNLDLFHKTITGTGGINMTGVVTATAFVGNGSGLTGVVASGTGVIIRNSGSVVGTAGTIDFGDNLSVSPASAGIVTITGSAGVDTSQFNVNKLDVSGISTFKGDIDVDADLDVDGHTNLDNVNIAGVTTFASDIEANGIFKIASAQPRIRLVDNDNNPNYSIFNSNGTWLVNDETSGADRLKITNTGVVMIPGDLDVDGHTNLDNVSIAGFTTITQDLNVDGHTNLDNVSIAGVVTATTLKGALQATSGSFSSTLDTVGINASGEINLDTHPARIKSSAGDLEIGVGTTSSFFVTGGPYTAERFEATVDCCILYSAGTKIARTHNGRFEIGNPVSNVGIGATFGITGNALFGGTGIVTATKFIGDGSELTGISASGISTSAGVVSIANDLDVDGHTNLDNVTIAGVATFSSVVNAATFSGAASANNLTSGVVPSARLSGTYNITNNGSAAQIVPVNETSDTENFIVFTNTATGGQTPKTNTGLKFNSSSGALTAVSFVGDGSGLSGVTAEGTGIAIREDDNPVGTASTINFTEGVSVTPVSSGITTVGIDTSQLNLGKLNVSGISTFNDDVQIESSIKHIGDTGTSIGFPSNQVISFVTNGGTRLQVGPLGQVGTGGANYGTSGQVLTSSGTSGAVQWTTVNPNVGITTALAGSFGSNPGNPTTINTYGYGTDDLVVEYTVHFYSGSSMQTQKVLASRNGTSITYTNFAIHYNSSLLVQCDVIRSGGDNFVLRATPESGVGGTISYRIKREVM